jgi:hypothetical protein
MCVVALFLPPRRTHARLSLFVLPALLDDVLVLCSSSPFRPTQNTTLAAEAAAAAAATTTWGGGTVQWLTAVEHGKRKQEQQLLHDDSESETHCNSDSKEEKENNKCKFVMNDEDNKEDTWEEVEGRL